MTVTAFLIVRNHSELLPIALDSVRPYVDRLLVVDTGSTDTTREVAAALGAVVIPFTWRNDFAAACNAALAAIDTSWALLLNPDETLSRERATLIRQAILLDDVFAFSIRVQQQLVPNLPNYGTSNRQWRLFRIHEQLRYQGRLHPYLNPAPDALAPRLGLQTKDLEVTLHRHAYRNQVTEDKIRWTVRLLEAELLDRPGQVDLMIELAQNLLLLGDTRGHDLFHRAAEILKPTLESNSPPTPGSGPLFEYLLTSLPPASVPGTGTTGTTSPSPTASNPPISRTQAFHFASQWMLRNPPVVWAMATERYRAKDYSTAAALLVQLLTLGREGNYQADLGFDPDILGRAAMLNLGKCYILLGKKEEARGALQAVAQDPVHGEEARKLLQKLATAAAG